ncbi:MAG TPA: recombinase RecA [Deltaproteobacteria bacterium]|nr:recombinase RecA [Deltaproteobacteria bacterium]HPR55513.1 recombinase RecA [Deltaproteobacteria bacterium]HXK48756.1 recombinase RecA [Deltaproteobacteria bacterium]
MEEGRKRALEDAITKIERSFGKGSIMRMGSDAIGKGVPVISTGSLMLDYEALAIGGIPRGRVTEIYGAESSGKTTLSLHCIASTQASGGVAAFIDAEHALDVNYAQKLGVNIDDLLVSQPDSGEQALDIAETLVRSNAVDIVVIDSVAALVPRAEIEGDMGDSHMGLQARLMSQALRKLSGAISKTKTTAVFINQTRQKIGVIYGNPETTTGGNALKFYASVRMQIKNAGPIKDGDKIVGNRTRVKIVKNKLAPPFREVEFDIMFGEGISRYGELLDVASQSDKNIIEKAGAWYTYNKQRLGQGRESAKTYLKEHPEVYQEISDAVKKTFAARLGTEQPE